MTTFLVEWLNADHLISFSASVPHWKPSQLLCDLAKNKTPFSDWAATTPGSRLWIGNKEFPFELLSMGLLPDTKIAGYACAGNARNVFPANRLQRKLLVNDPDMHHATCVAHVPWCMSGSLTRGGRENVPGIPGACATHNFAHLVRGPWRGQRQTQWADCQ